MLQIPPLVTYDHTERLLQTVTGIDISFDSATKTIADVHAAFSEFYVGMKFVVSGAGEAANQTTFTVASVASNYKSVVVVEAVTDDAAGDAIVINEEYWSDWKYCGDRSKLVGSVNCTSNAVVYIDQGTDASNTEYTTTGAIVGGTPYAWEIAVLYQYARMRIRNNGTTQTVLRASHNGRSVT